ncbi:hypothetical protein BHM03_00057095 [Ensete ventricosum]|nr:hypothetical protein BHM03_00057095 [Ensete ventricosum]
MHGFMKKHNSHKLRASCRVSIGFSCMILEFQNTSHSQCIISPWEVVRALFREKMRRS